MIALYSEHMFSILISCSSSKNWVSILPHTMKYIIFHFGFVNVFLLMFGETQYQQTIVCPATIMKRTTIIAATTIIIIAATTIITIATTIITIATTTIITIATTIITIATTIITVTVISWLRMSTQMARIRIRDIKKTCA